MKRIMINVRTAKTDLLKKVEIAEQAISSFYEVAKELECFDNGLSERISIEDNATDTDKTSIWITKSIDEEAIKEPLERVRKLIAQLKDETRKLDAAIITDLTKKKPQA